MNWTVHVMFHPGNVPLFVGWYARFMIMCWYGKNTYISHQLAFKWFTLFYMCTVTLHFDHCLFFMFQMYIPCVLGLQLLVCVLLASCLPKSHNILIDVTWEFCNGTGTIQISWRLWCKVRQLGRSGLNTEHAKELSTLYCRHSVKDHFCFILRDGVHKPLLLFWSCV